MASIGSGTAGGPVWAPAALTPRTKVAILSTESIASSSPTDAGAAAHCASCGAPLAADQRYCLECGVRRVPMSSVLSGEPPLSGDSPSPATPSTPPTPPAPPGVPSAFGAPQRNNNTLTVIAGVGVLLLAMGVGVLIGRASASSKQSPAQAQVITVAGPASTGTSTGSSEASFTGDWPSGTSGYTVQLQTLPQSGTAPAPSKRPSRRRAPRAPKRSAR